MSQALVKLTCKLTPNQKKFIAEVIGTFIVVVFATGSVVIDSRLHGVLGIPFIAFAPFVGIAIGVYIFGKISMAYYRHLVMSWSDMLFVDIHYVLLLNSISTAKDDRA